MSALELARDERSDLADLLDTLTPEQWYGPTLCDEWRVRDVVAHLIGYEELGVGGLLVRIGRGLRSGDVHGSRIAELSGCDTGELVAMVRRNLTPRGVTAMFGGKIGLVDGLIHQQDIRRPLGLAREIPPERLRIALDFACFAPPLGGGPRTKGLRVVATDVGWSRGDGPLVEGPAEPLLMAIAGRRGIAHELTGPGVATLAARSG